MMLMVLKISTPWVLLLKDSVQKVTSVHKELLLLSLVHLELTSQILVKLFAKIAQLAITALSLL